MLMSSSCKQNYVVVWTIVPELINKINYGRRTVNVLKTSLSSTLLSITIPHVVLSESRWISLCCVISVVLSNERIPDCRCLWDRQKLSGASCILVWVRSPGSSLMNARFLRCSEIICSQQKKLGNCTVRCAGENVTSLAPRRGRIFMALLRIHL